MLCRQKLRSMQASSAFTAEGNTSAGHPASTTGKPGMTGSKRPLSDSISGWEDLIEEASADLEQLEGHISNAAQRLASLTSQNVQLAQAADEAMAKRLDAEQLERQALDQLKVGGRFCM